MALKHEGKEENPLVPEVARKKIALEPRGCIPHAGRTWSLPGGQRWRAESRTEPLLPTERRGHGRGIAPSTQRGAKARLEERAGSCRQNESAAVCQPAREPAGILTGLGTEEEAQEVRAVLHSFFVCTGKGCQLQRHCRAQHILPRDRPVGSSSIL